MSSRPHRLLRTVLIGTSALMFAGCSSSKSSEISVTNVSDAWFDVTFFVEVPDQDAASSSRRLVGGSDLQIRPGETRSYSLKRHAGYDEETRPLVHFRVRPVMPSWEEAMPEYWMELLTLPPVTIVATGTSQRIEFVTGDGALARIPDLGSKRFVYVTPDDTAATERSLDLASAADVDSGSADASKP